MGERERVKFSSGVDSFCNDFYLLISHQERKRKRAIVSVRYLLCPIGKFLHCTGFLNLHIIKNLMFRREKERDCVIKFSSVISLTMNANIQIVEIVEKITVKLLSLKLHTLTFL